MIEEYSAYSLHCDYEHGCNNFFDGEVEVSEKDVVKFAESEDWMVKGRQCYCPDHRPNVEESE